MTVTQLKAAKGADRPLVWVTAYDYPFAVQIEAAGVDTILVGDSLGNTALGHAGTQPVTLDDMVRAARAVARGAPRTLRVVDLPFLTYTTPADAVCAARRLVQDGAADAVKLEGGAHVAPQIRALTQFGVAVVAHLGYTPQSASLLGRRVQGRGSEAAQRLVDDANAVVEAGAVAVVLEQVPAELGARVTAAVPVPTIGIGAGSATDGQVLVLTDLLGLTVGRVPKFVRPYAALGEAARDAVARYAADVRAGTFPAPEHAFHDPEGGAGEGP